MSTRPGRSAWEVWTPIITDTSLLTAGPMSFSRMLAGIGEGVRCEGIGCARAGVGRSRFRVFRVFRGSGEHYLPCSLVRVGRVLNHRARL